MAAEFRCRCYRFVTTRRGRSFGLVMRSTALTDLECALAEQTNLKASGDSFRPVSRMQFL
jgi:hypothetical protein